MHQRQYVTSAGPRLSSAVTAASNVHVCTYTDGEFCMLREHKQQPSACKKRSDGTLHSGHTLFLAAQRDMHSTQNTCMQLLTTALSFGLVISVRPTAYNRRE